MCIMTPVLKSSSLTMKYCPVHFSEYSCMRAKRSIYWVSLRKHIIGNKQQHEMTLKDVKIICRKILRQ